MGKIKLPLTEGMLLRKVIGITGITLILAGYFCLGIDPDTEPAIAIKRAFAGMGLVITGAAMSLLALILSR